MPESTMPNAYACTKQLYNAVDKAIRKQVTDMVDDQYIRGLRNPHTGFSQQSALDILEYLFSQYGDISDQELQDNDRKMKEAYNMQIHP